MAHALHLQSASYIIDLLDGDAQKLLYGTYLGQPALEHFFAMPYGRGFDPLASYRVGNRVATMPVLLAGSTMDGLITNTQQVKDALDRARRFHAGEPGEPLQLVIKPNGATNTTVFDVIEGQLDDGTFFNPAIGSFKIYESTLRLTMRSFGRTQRLRTNVSGTLNNGGGVTPSSATYTLAAPSSGEVPGPAIVEVQTAAGDTWQRLILAKISRGDVADIANYFILQCETTAGTGYTVTDINALSLAESDEIVAAASGGYVRRYTGQISGSETGNLLRWELTGPLASVKGRYHVWLKVQADANAVIDAVKLQWGGTDGLLRSNASVTSPGGPYMHYLGTVEVGQDGGGVTNSFKMVLNLTYTSGIGDVFELDNLFFYPADGELLDVEFTATTAAQDIMVSDHTEWHPQAYAVDSSGNVKLLVRSTPWIDTGFTRSPGNSDLYLPLLLSKSGSNYTLDLTHQLTITVNDYPLFSLFDA